MYSSFMEIRNHLTKTIRNGGSQSIYEIVYIDNQIVYSIETYLIPIYHMNKCSK